MDVVDDTGTLLVGLLDGLALAVVLAGLLLRVRPSSRRWAPRGARRAVALPRAHAHTRLTGQVRSRAVP